MPLPLDKTASTLCNPLKDARCSFVSHFTLLFFLNINQQRRADFTALQWVPQVRVHILCGCRPFDSTSVCLYGLTQSCMHDEFEEPLCVPSSIPFILSRDSPSSANQLKPHRKEALHWATWVRVSMLGGCSEPSTRLLSHLCGMKQSCMHDEYEEPLCIPLSVSPILTRVFPPFTNPAIASGVRSTALGIAGTCINAGWL